MPHKIKFYKKSNAGSLESHGKESRVSYTIYDCSIEDVEERKQKALQFNSAKAVAEFLGIQRVHLPHYTSRQAIATKKRFLSRKQGGKEFAIRLSKK